MGLTQSVSTKLDSECISKCLGKKNHEPVQFKPSFTSLQLALHSQGDNLHQTKAHPSDCQIEKRDLSLHKTHFHCSPVLWWPAFTPLHPTLGMVLGDVSLSCSCLAMETYTMKFPTQSICADLDARRSFGTLKIVDSHSPRSLQISATGRRDVLLERY